MTLRSNFPNEFEAVEDLFGAKQVAAELPRMEMVFAACEDYWDAYLKMVPGQQVRYLMLAEAPPCSDDGEIQYIFNPSSRPRTLITALVKAFFGEPIYKEVGMAATLERLAERGFLLIDASPFAMSYSKGGKRGKAGYASLVAATARSYMLAKINGAGIDWHADVRVAFSLRKTAEALIASFPEGIPFASLGRTIAISEAQVAVNAANYPDAEKIKALYGLG